MDYISNKKRFDNIINSCSNFPNFKEIREFADECIRIFDSMNLDDENYYVSIQYIALVISMYDTEKEVLNKWITNIKQNGKWISAISDGCNSKCSKMS